MKRKKTKIPEVVFCPNPECNNHNYIYEYNYFTTSNVVLKTYSKNWYNKKGFHENKSQNLLVRRLICKDCGTTFSTQFFTPTYYKKQKVDLKRLLVETANSSSIKNIQNIENIEQSNIAHSQYLLARQVMGYNAIIRSQLKLNEDVVIDGLENKIRSKFFPMDFNIAVGAKSQYIMYFDNSHYRRKGRQTKKQKETQKKFNKIYNYERASTKKSIKRMLKELNKHGLSESDIYLRSDEKKEYKTAIKELNKEPEFDIKQKTISSKKARTLRNKLFAANYTDREIRKDEANYRRKTACISKELNKDLARNTLFIFFHNYYKDYRVKNPNLGHHYNQTNIKNNKVNVIKENIYKYRVFYSSVEDKLSEFEKMLWKAKVKSPLGKTNYRIPKYAMQ